jgi:hypothetical protein
MVMVGNVFVCYHAAMQPNPPPAPRVRLAITVVVVVASILLWGGVLMELLVTVPAAERMASEFKMQVPPFTDAVFACSRILIRQPVLMVIPLAIVSAVVGSLTWLVRHRLNSPPLSVVWCVAMVVMPVAAALLIWYSCVVPMTTLMEELNGKKAHGTPARRTFVADASGSPRAPDANHPRIA